VSSGACETPFTGFTPATVGFLESLAVHNDKTWFEAHKRDYQVHLLAPLQRLVVDLAPTMEAIDPLLEVRPTVGKTISRIYRDTRFSSDKSPLRSKMWITFKRPSKDWLDRPTYFFELASHAYRFGMGFYAATPRTMDQFRERVARDPAAFLAAVAFYPDQSVFALEGESYRRAIANGLPAEIQPWYQKKTFYLEADRALDDLLFRPELVGELTAGFRLLAPLYHFLLGSSAPR